MSSIDEFSSKLQNNKNVRNFHAERLKGFEDKLRAHSEKNSLIGKLESIHSRLESANEEKKIAESIFEVSGAFLPPKKKGYHDMNTISRIDSIIEKVRKREKFQRKFDYGFEDEGKEFQVSDDEDKIERIKMKLFNAKKADFGESKMLENYSKGISSSLNYSESKFGSRVDEKSKFVSKENEYTENNQISISNEPPESQLFKPKKDFKDSLNSDSIRSPLKNSSNSQSQAESLRSNISKLKSLYAKTIKPSISQLPASQYSSAKKSALSYVSEDQSFFEISPENSISNSELDEPQKFPIREDPELSKLQFQMAALDEELKKYEGLR